MRPTPLCPAITFRTMAKCDACGRIRSRAPFRSCVSPTGSTPMSPSRTAWWTGSPRRRGNAKSVSWPTITVSTMQLAGVLRGIQAVGARGSSFRRAVPALEKVGVQFVPDVAPYEHMKIRILNGGHAAIAYPAALLDIHFVHEAMEDPDGIRAFLAKLELKTRSCPVIPPVPDTDLNARLFQKGLESNGCFSNPEDRRYHSASRAGRLQPPAEIHPAVDGRSSVGASEDVTGLVARLRALVPLSRWHDGQRSSRSASTIPTSTGIHAVGRSGQGLTHEAFLAISRIFLARVAEADAFSASGSHKALTHAAGRRARGRR